MAFVPLGWGTSSRARPSVETSLPSAPTSSISGGPMRRSWICSPGTCRSGCAKRYWTIRRRIAPSSMRYSKNADVFFANKRPGYLEQHGFGAEELSAKRPGLIHATVALHGDKGPWSDRPGFDEIGAAVAGIFAIEGTLSHPKSPPIIPICDNVVAWLGTVGIMEALRRRAVDGGSYRVVVSLTRTVLWLISLGIFDKSYAKATAGSSDVHANVDPDLFTAETPLGTYQGITDQVMMSRTPSSFGLFSCPGAQANRSGLQRELPRPAGFASRNGMHRPVRHGAAAYRSRGADRDGPAGALAVSSSIPAFLPGRRQGARPDSRQRHVSARACWRRQRRPPGISRHRPD